MTHKFKLIALSVLVLACYTMQAQLIPQTMSTTPAVLIVMADPNITAGSSASNCAIDGTQIYSTVSGQMFLCSKGSWTRETNPQMVTAAVIPIPGTACLASPPQVSWSDTEFFICGPGGHWLVAGAAASFASIPVSSVPVPTPGTPCVASPPQVAWSNGIMYACAPNATWQAYGAAVGSTSVPVSSVPPPAGSGGSCTASPPQISWTDSDVFVCTPGGTWMDLFQPPPTTTPVCDSAHAGRIYYVTAGGGSHIEACLDTTGSGSYSLIILGQNIGHSPYGYVNALYQAGMTHYNDQFYGLNGWANTGSFVFGDTVSCAWADDSNYYCTWNDGQGVSGATQPTATNIGVLRLNAAANSAVNINDMAVYGVWTQANTNGWTDNATWKTAGMASVNGHLYMTVQRQLDAPPFTMADSSLVESCDHGATWSNYTHAGSTGCGGANSNGDPPTGGQSMWVNTPGFTPITYCQDNSISCPTVDANRSYVYLTSLTQDQTGMLLARVPASVFQTLDVTKYQYWVGGANGGASGGLANTANWSTNIALATPIVTGGVSQRFSKGQAYFVQQLGKYTMILNSNGWNFMTYTASTVGGPWVYSGKLTDEHHYHFDFPCLLLGTAVSTGTSPPSISVKMLGIGSADTSIEGSPVTWPFSQWYSIHFRELLLTDGTALTQQQQVDNFNDGLTPYSLISDLAFLPEDGTTVTNYSGGPSGTEVYEGTYNLQGMNSWYYYNYAYGTAFTVNTNIGFAGNDFTMFIVFKENAAYFSNEVILSDMTPGGSDSLEVSRYGGFADIYNINVMGQNVQVNLQDGAWNMLILQRSGSTVNIYNSASFLNGSILPAATLTGVNGNLNGNPIVLGAKVGDNTVNGSQDWFYGEIARFAFYSESLDTSSLQVNETQLDQEMHARGVYLPRGQNTGERVLDFAGPRAAWSLRRVKSSYTGPAIQVQRSSDNATQNIGFNGADDLDTTPLMSFCSGVTCHVIIWYDQGGSGYNLTPVSGAGPVIVSSGTLQTAGTNSKPAVTFPTGAEGMGTGTSFYFAEWLASVNAVCQMESSTFAWTGIVTFLDPGPNAQSNPSTSLMMTRNSTGPGYGFMRFNTPVSGSSGGTDGVQSVVWTGFDNKTMRLTVDNVPSNVTFLGIPAGYEFRYHFTQIQVGGGLTGSISEVVVMPYMATDQARRSIGINQKAYYGTGGTYTPLP